MNALATKRDAAGRLAGPLLVALVAVAMLVWTWRKWADPMIDFGGEAYVAWRLSAGDVLYRDLAYFTGPLSPYVNALCLRSFGVSVTNLAVVNLVLLAGTFTLLYRLLAGIASHFAATCACILFAILSAFALHQGAGNYNFVWPYSHEVTHATLLSLIALSIGARWLRAPSIASALGVGFVFGLAFLTKVEFTAALGAALLMMLAAAPIEMRVKTTHALLAITAAFVAPLIAFAALASAMPAAEAWRGMLGAWPYVGDEKVGGFPLYRFAMGLEPLGFHARNIALWAVGTIALVFVMRFAAARFGAVASTTATAVICAALFAVLPWVDVFYPLTFYMAAALLYAWTQRRADVHGPLRVAYVALALVLLLRIALNARVQFYGFALAAPAVTVFVLALTHWIPERTGDDARARRLAALPLLGAIVLGHVLPMARGMRWNRIELGRGSDRMIVSPRGELVQRAIELVEQRCPTDGAVLVLPEGALINYIARRRAPTRYFNFMPPELAMFGESNMVAALHASPPDMIVLIHRDTLEYGVPYFGRDYGREIYEWVLANYRPAKLWSVVPNQKPFEPGTQHAVAVLERKR